MSFPVGVPIGPWTGHPHVFFETLAYLVGFRLYLWRRRRLGDHLEDGPRWSVITAAAIGAVAGSRLLFWLEDPAATLQALRQPSIVLGGKTIVGALLGGLVAVEITKRWLGVREATGDLFAVPLAVGIAIGRVGCFLSGLADGTYGTATTLPWGFDLGDGVSRHPVALYESAFLIALLPVLVWTADRVPRGETFKLFMVSYLAFRLAVDALKPGVPMLAGLTSIQLACLAGLGYYAGWFLTRRRLPLPATAAQVKEAPTS